MKLSIVIPSYKDPLLFKTLNSILENFEEEYEIIPVLDGYTPKQEFQDTPKIRPIYLKNNVGMREAINFGVQQSTGEYVMRTDEHCKFGRGFDRIILSTIQDNWIVTARRYQLDPKKWKIIEDKPPVDYEKLMIKTIDEHSSKFTGVRWKSRERERCDIRIDETMAMQGSCWIMARSWWDNVIGRLQTEGYGPMYQDSTEMVFKTWMANGKLMVNKSTWFAHKHRSFNRTHHYPTQRAIPEWEYALEKWKREYERIKPKWGIK